MDNSAEMADARLEQIIEAITNQDRDSLREMFSSNALSEAKNLDLGIDYLFSLIEDRIIKWDRIGGSVDESNDYGLITKKSRYRYNVFTQNEQYLFSILEYTEDTNDSNNIGLYCLKVINVKDDEPIFSNAGIFIPDEHLQ